MLALPFVVWTAAFAAFGVGMEPQVVQAIAVVAVGFTLLAFVVLVRPMGGVSGVGMRRGAVEGSFVRTLEDHGRAECRVDDVHVIVVHASGDAKSYRFADLSLPRIDDRAACCDLVLDDVYGDPLLRLRTTSADERAKFNAVADEISRRVAKTRSER